MVAAYVLPRSADALIGFEMSSSVRLRHQLAFGFLILGKALGIGGLVLAFAGHPFGGGVMLALDGAFIVTAIVIALRVMSERAKEEAGHKQVLAQMVREGTLKQYLRDLQTEDTGSDASRSELPCS
jgi:hypothetical protein